MYITKTDRAWAAAYRIVDALESAGVDLTDAIGIARGTYYEYMPSDIQYASGASRVAIWDECCDFVIKIAFSKNYEKYCQHEVEVYAAAVKEGLEDNFAWCVCYQEPEECEDDYRPGIYVMEYMECDEEAVRDSAWKYGYESYCRERGLDSSNYDHAEDYDDWNWNEDNEMVLDYIEAQMDEETRRAFCVFMMKWQVSDIHEGNCGFKNNRMVIVDYAGWNW